MSGSSHIQPITNLNSLQLEIDRLYYKKEEIEQTLSQNLVYLQKDYPHMIRRTIFKKAGYNETSPVLQTILLLPKVQELLSKLSEKLSAKIGAVLLRWFEKLTQ